jgi:D-alanyl-D-alanine carboxypeptidase/D-alanyl-D-alanine-endopeptidase (penicillin-binding protein 4)
MLGACAVCICISSATAAGPLPTEIAKALRLHEISEADLSLYVQEVTETAPRLSINAGVPRVPASTIKLLTTAAGLDSLGSTYRWRTRAYLGGPLVDGRLDGDLIIEGSGDPDFRNEDLWHFLWELRARGLKTIGGDLVIDNGAFERPSTARGEFDGKGDSAYNALPAAFSVNHQLTEVHMMADRAAGSLRVYLVPPLARVTLDNQARLVKAPCQGKHHKLNMRVEEQGRAATLRLSGTFASECHDQSITSLVLDPATHAGNAFLGVWEQLGGELKGQLREGPRPAGASLFHTVESDELGVEVRDINKWSNNLMTRTLFLTLGAERYGRPGSLAKGRAAIRDWLDEKGIEMPELVIDNGSGLSRETRISAGSMGRLLAWAYTNPTMSELIASLAIAGVDGTVQSRFKRDTLRGHAHLKTGTLRGATGLAGFVDDVAGRRWILVSLINNPRLQGWRGKAVENTILHWVYEQASASAPAAVQATSADRALAGQ